MEAIGTPLGGDITAMAETFFAAVVDPRERAELRAIFARAAEAQRQRTAYWEVHRPEPTIDGRPFQPIHRTPGEVPAEPPPYGPPHDWAHDGTELWDRDLTGRVIPHGVGYRCLVCRDSGYVGQELEVGHAEFGQSHQCACQTEDAAARAALIRTRLARSGIPTELARCTLETFIRRDGTTHALNAIYALCTAHRTGAELPRWLVLYGPPGTGKTHLLTAALQQMLPMAEGFGATLGLFLDACKANQFARDADLTMKAIEAPILMVDEVGAQGDGDWGREKVERILNARYERRAWTLLGVTVGQPNVEQWSPRLASRFSDRRLVVSATLTCGDYRKTPVEVAHAGPILAG